MRRLRGTVMAFVLLAAAGCGENIGPHVVPGHAPAPPVTTTTTVAPSTTKKVDLGPAPTRLEAVDWKRATFAGDFCDVPHTVTMSGGESVANRPDGEPTHFSTGDVAYGDLDGDGLDEAALNVLCDNDGGTAAGQLASAYIVYGISRGELEQLGAIVATRQLDGSHVSLLSGATLRRPVVSVHEDYYRASDPDCCPSGSATTEWTLTPAGLVETRSVATS